MGGYIIYTDITPRRYAPGTDINSFIVGPIVTMHLDTSDTCVVSEAARGNIYFTLYLFTFLLLVVNKDCQYSAVISFGNVGLTAAV